MMKTDIDIDHDYCYVRGGLVTVIYFTFPPGKNHRLNFPRKKCAANSTTTTNQCVCQLVGELLYGLCLSLCLSWKELKDKQGSPLSTGNSDLETAFHHTLKTNEDSKRRSTHTAKQSHTMDINSARTSKKNNWRWHFGLQCCAARCWEVSGMQHSGHSDLWE